MSTTDPTNIFPWSMCTDCHQQFRYNAGTGYISQTIQTTYFSGASFHSRPTTRGTYSDPSTHQIYQRRNISSMSTSALSGRRTPRAIQVTFCRTLSRNTHSVVLLRRGCHISSCGYQHQNARCWFWSGCIVFPTPSRHYIIEGHITAQSGLPTSSLTTKIALLLQMWVC